MKASPFYSMTFTNHICKDLFPNRVSFWASWGSLRPSTYNLGWTQFNRQQHLKEAHILPIPCSTRLKQEWANSAYSSWQGKKVERFFPKRIALLWKKISRHIAFHMRWVQLHEITMLWNTLRGAMATSAASTTQPVFSLLPRQSCVWAQSEHRGVFNHSDEL